jgi:ABC-type amino acid transport substrate-binding protein
MDVVRLHAPHSAKDVRHIYPNVLLASALERTVADYGPYTIEESIAGMQRDRALQELVTGRTINVMVAVTREEWEKTTLPVRIPLLKGLLGYRLFLIKSEKQHVFDRVEDVADLKELRAGLRQQWSTTAVMKTLGFKIVEGTTYEGLFRMLSRERFDYFPRGVNEIFTELETHNVEYPDLAIEKGLALYLPSPSYFFVSPQNPRLAERIEKGLLMMIADGTFDSIFNTFQGDNIARAGLEKRQILQVDNPLLPATTPFDRKELWYTPAEHND